MKQIDEFITVIRWRFVKFNETFVKTTKMLDIFCKLSYNN